MLRTLARSSLRFAPRATMAPTMSPLTMMRLNHTLIKGSIPDKYSDKYTLKFTEDHDWVAFHKDGTTFIGITKYAAEALGDATFVEVEEAGSEIEKDGVFGNVESVKATNDIIAPFDFEVVESNFDVADTPSLINKEPNGNGYLAKVKHAEGAEETDGLLSAEEYDEFLKNAH